jgi:hypothetical protein
LVQPAGADPIRSFLVFLHLLEREPKSVGDLFLLNPTIMRRMRTRLPTCLSIGFGPVFFACMSSPGPTTCDGARATSGACPASWGLGRQRGYT